jgi:hypothetical protein
MTAMPDYYLVQATISHETPEGFTHVRQVPSFALPTHILGIVSAEHAEKIARDVLSAEGREVSLVVGAAE